MGNESIIYGIILKGQIQFIIGVDDQALLKNIKY